MDDFNKAYWKILIPALIIGGLLYALVIYLVTT